MRKNLLCVLFFLFSACLMPLSALAQVSLEEYFDTKDMVSDDKSYVFGEGNHSNLEFAETDAFQNLMASAKAALNNGNARIFVPKDKRESIVCRRNGKYYVLEYCKISDIVSDDDGQQPAAAQQQTRNDMTPKAANGVAFAFENGEIIDAAGKSQPALVAPMQEQLSMLLSEINRAHNANAEPCLDAIKIDDKAKRMFLGLWSAFPFVCNSASYTLPALCDVRGYQVRGIDITKKAVEDEEENTDHQLCVCFDPSGTITCVNFAKSMNFKKLNPNVIDKRRELEILQFIENFRTYYVNHDLEALEALFSEDAIIITGKVTMKRDPASKKDSPKFSKSIKYEVKDKKQYMKSLASVFAKYPKIDVKFEDIKLSQHPSRESVYAVNLVQTWNSKSYHGYGYSDIGYLHLLFDFPDHGDPRIHVRAWQPLETEPKDIITIDSYDD